MHKSACIDSVLTIISLCQSKLRSYHSGVNCYMPAFMSPQVSDVLDISLICLGGKELDPSQEVLVSNLPLLGIKESHFASWFSLVGLGTQSLY